MATFTEWDVLEFACLNKQVVEWVACPHSPRHSDLADEVVLLLGTTDPVTIRAVRSRRAWGTCSLSSFPGQRRLGLPGTD